MNISLSNLKSNIYRDVNECHDLPEAEKEAREAAKDEISKTIPVATNFPWSITFFYIYSY